MSASIIRESGERLTFEATGRLGLSRDATVTTHPVERGADVADHSQAQAEVIVLEGVVSETRGGSRPEEARAFLDAVVLSGELVAVEHPRFGTRFRFVVEGYGCEYSTARRVRLSIRCRQVRIAEAVQVEIPPGQPVPVASDLAAATDAGRQGTTELDPRRDAQTKSVAAALADWLGG